MTDAISNVGFNELGSSYKGRKDLLDVTAEFAEKRFWTLCKAGYVLPGFLQKTGFLPDDDPNLNNACHGFKLAKLSRAPFELVKYAHETFERTALWLKGEKKEFKEKFGKKTPSRNVEATDVFRSFNKCVNPIWEGVDFLKRTFLYIPSQALYRTLEGVNGGALVVGMGWNAYDTLNWISKSDYAASKGIERDKKFSEMTGYLLKLVKEVAYADCILALEHGHGHPP